MTNTTQLTNYEPYTLANHYIRNNNFAIGIGINLLETKQMPKIEQVIFQKDLTIVVWADKERTIVKCSEEEFDKEKGLAMAIAKRFMDRNKFKKLLDTAVIQDK